MRNRHVLHFTSVVLVLFTFLLIEGGCRKKPVAEFSLQKYEYVPGDQLEIQNLSDDYKTCKWEILDAHGSVVQTLEENNPNLVLNILLENGAYTLRLTALSKKEKKTVCFRENVFGKNN